MPNNYTIIVSDEVDSAIKKKAARDNITPDALIQTQLEYYIGCALYRDFDPNSPVNCPGLTITERLEVYAEGENKDEAAARVKVTSILAARG